MYKTKEEVIRKWDISIKNEIYQEFKIFCNNDNLPDFETEYSDINGSTECAMSVNPILRPPIILHINTDFMIQKPELIKQSLFHEFTHIYDWIELQKIVMLMNNKIIFYRVYTEFHAKQVELACVLGFEKMDNYVQFKSSTQIPYYGSILKLSVKLCTEAEVCRNCFIEEPNKTNLNNFILTTFYYLGTANLCKKYCSIEYLWSTDYLEEFENDFNDIAMRLSKFKNTKYEINSIVERIIKLKKDLRLKYKILD